MLRALGVGFVLGCAVIAAWADDDEKDEVPPERRDLRQKLASVKEWQGLWETHIAGGGAKHDPVGADIEYRSDGQTHGSFLLKRYKYSWEPRRGIFKWKGDGDVTGRVQAHYSYSNTAELGSGAEWDSYQAGAYAVHGVEFEVWLTGKTPTASFLPGGWGVDGKWDDRAVLPRRTVNGRKWSRSSTRDPFTVTPITGDIHWQFAWGNLSALSSAEKGAVVSGGSTVLEFKCEVDDNSIQEHVEYGTPRARITTRVMLIPVYDNLEVEVTIDGYDEWRPKGKIADPKKPGNDLKVRATLKSKDGKPVEVMSPVRRFIFELKDTSREPGICLNWPLNAKDNDPDLRLAAVRPNDQLSQEDQKLIVKDVLKDEQDQPYAEAQVDSYDFGGRAELRVTCELEDGREVIGLIKDDKGSQDLVRLPKMDGPGWIAESWRKQKGVTDLADNDDEEKVEGQDYKGDGFTLYEEYRGFVENGVHIEGDPKKKDLFILNLADVSTRNGISLLEQLAKLKTHARLQNGKEMNSLARLMNGNHRAAPHRVDQHGVNLSNSADITNYKGIGGGFQASIKEADTDKAGRPGTTSYCYIVEPDSARGIFSAKNLKYYNLTHLSVNQLYAAAVAHELLHAIGLDHHGETLMVFRWALFESEDSPHNPTKNPRFFDEGPGGEKGALLKVLWEDGGNVADDHQVMFYNRLAEYPEGVRASLHDAAEYWCNRFLAVGQPGGTDSGDESCVMRYYFATAYEAKGKKDTVYVIRPGVKSAENALCTSPKGTGGNAASHQPQSRFGDAAGGRGNCFSQICPNDAIPPRSIKLK